MEVYSLASIRGKQSVNNISYSPPEQEYTSSTSPSAHSPVIALTIPGCDIITSICNCLMGFSGNLLNNVASARNFSTRNKSALTTCPGIEES